MVGVVLIKQIIKNSLHCRYESLPKEVKEQIPYADFVKNSHQIELIVETVKNVLVGRKSISIDIYNGKRVKHGVFYKQC